MINRKRFLGSIGDSKMENKSLRAETQSNAGGQFSGGGAQFKESPRSISSASGSPISESLARGKDAVGSAANEAIDSAGTDLQSLQTDLNGLKDTLTKFMSQAAGEAAKSAREVSSQRCWPCRRCRKRSGGPGSRHSLHGHRTGKDVRV
jgi:hypothetical protein